VYVLQKINKLNQLNLYRLKWIIKYLYQSDVSLVVKLLEINGNFI
jgi:hypothetical protein